MARASRSFTPSQIWHITHRCHKKEFLLKFKRDRERWLYWLFEAKKRVGLTVLNYMVTSNHIHLLVEDGEAQEIAQSMQLIAGRTAQEYNQRKNRQGALWGDRYHATAVDTHDYLIRCMVYIDLNMVRAGKVNHPSEWSESGYNEIKNRPKRYQIINRERLCELVGIKNTEVLTDQYAQWVEEALAINQNQREEKWSTSLAVGSLEYTEGYVDQMGSKASYRKVKLLDDCCVVKEPKLPYDTDL